MTDPSEPLPEPSGTDRRSMSPDRRHGSRRARTSPGTFPAAAEPVGIGWAEAPPTAPATPRPAPRAAPGRADWESLFERYRRLVYAVPRRRGLPPCDCDDVFQATWLTAVRRGDPPADEAHVVRWLAAIASWETRGLLRRRRPQPQAPESLDARTDGKSDVPERELALAERHGALEGALRAIGDRDRRLLEALFLADEPLSYDAVAERFGVRPGSVGPLRIRALDRLRSELTRRGF